VKVLSLTVRYPEIEHLPVDERVALLERGRRSAAGRQGKAVCGGLPR
jgi:hypothetical protein